MMPACSRRGTPCPGSAGFGCSIIGVLPSDESSSLATVEGRRPAHSNSKRSAMIPLKQFLEQTSEQVEQLFKKTGRLLPMYHVVEQNGRHVIMPPPPDATKDEAIALIKALFLLIRPQRYIFCDEAWTIDAHGEEAIARAIDFVRSHGSAKDHPDCKEV